MINITVDGRLQTYFLPREIVHKVVSFLDPKNIARILTVNKDFFQHLSSNDLWRELCPKVSTKNVTDNFYLTLYPDQMSINLAKNARIGNLKVLKALWGHGGSIACLKASDETIISGSHDRSIRIWNRIASLQANSFDLNAYEVEMVHLDHQGNVIGLEIIDNNFVIASLFKKTILIRDRSTGDEICSLVGHRKGVTCLLIKDKMIISGSEDYTIRFWDQAGLLKRTLNGHEEAVTCLQAIDEIIISGSEDKTICIWDQTKDSPVNILSGHEAPITGLKVTNEAIISCSNDKTIRIWDRSTYTLRNTLKGHTNDIFCLEIIHNSIFSCSRDNTMRIWDLSSGNLLQTFELEGIDMVPRCMTFFEDNLITGSEDGGIRIWGRV